MAPPVISSLAFAKTVELTRWLPTWTTRPVLLRGRHLIALADAVGHGLLTINILTGIAAINQHLLMPMVRRRTDDAVDILALQQFLIAPSGGDRLLAHNFLGQTQMPIVDVAAAAHSAPEI